jgi:hypothetical protein
MRLERNWVFNDSVISPRKLRIYFVKKYMLKQFLAGEKTEAAWAVKQLILNKSFDFVLLKSILKLFFKGQLTWKA